MPIVMPNPDAVAKSKSVVALEEVNLSSAVSRFKNAMGSLEQIFVSRTEEINALMLAIISGQHILFEGGAGVAKSDLARECFARITGDKLVIYDKMFGKGTKEDDVFGPVDMTKYRENAEWTHNTKGSLAGCHFANLEELGRASDLLLPSMMTVLNERLFHNGSAVMRCPLITAVASTNFLTDSDELAAFNDRWLIRILVKPLDTNQKCIEMLTRSLSPRPALKETITLTEIVALNRAVASIQCEPEVVPLYVDLVKSYVRACSSKPSLNISDRRLVHALRLAKAAAILDERSTVSADDLDAVKFGVSIFGKDDEQVFSNELQRVVGNATEIRKETEHVTLMAKFLRQLTNTYDPQLPTRELNKLKSDSERLISGMRARPDPIKVPQNQSKFDEILRDAEALLSSVQHSLDNR